MSGGTGMPEGQLFLVSGNKGRSSGEWSDDDYDVRDGATDGPVVGEVGLRMVSVAWLLAIVTLRPIRGDGA